MTIVMNMSGYAVEKLVAPVEEYGGAVMCSGLNPQLALANEYGAPRADRHISLPSGLENVDIDVFLRKMYANQR
jgi:hypothetical protein